MARGGRSEIRIEDSLSYETSMEQELDFRFRRPMKPRIRSILRCLNYSNLEPLKLIYETAFAESIPI